MNAPANRFVHSTKIVRNEILCLPVLLRKDQKLFCNECFIYMNEASVISSTGAQCYGAEAAMWRIIVVKTLADATSKCISFLITDALFAKEKIVSGGA
jgi:hypothetical protein